MKTKLVLAVIGIVVFAAVGYFCLVTLSQNAERIADSSFELCRTHSVEGADCSGSWVNFEAGTSTRMLVSGLVGAVAALLVLGAVWIGLRLKRRSSPGLD